MDPTAGDPSEPGKKKSKIRRAWSAYRWFDRVRGWHDWSNWIAGLFQTKAGVVAAVGTTAAVTTAGVVVVHNAIVDRPPPPPIEIAAPKLEPPPAPPPPAPPPEPVKQASNSVIFAIEGKDKAGRRGAFDVVVAQKDFLWVRKSSDDLEKAGKTIPGSDIAKEVFDADIKSGLDAAEGIIAVGTASQEGDAREEKERAGKRAQRTATLVAEAVDAKIPIWTLNLGQYRDPCKDCEAGGTNWQRPFMVIAIKDLEADANLGEALADAMTGKEKLPSPKSYSAFDLAKLR